VAYVRFASVYREFSDVRQFVDTLQSLGDKRPPEEGSSALKDDRAAPKQSKLQD